MKKTVEIWGDDYRWLEEEFNNPSLSWVVSALIKNLREVCENPREFSLESNTIKHLAREAAKLTRIELEA